MANDQYPKEWPGFYWWGDLTGDVEALDVLNIGGITFIHVRRVAEGDSRLCNLNELSPITPFACEFLCYAKAQLKARKYK